MPGAMIEVLPQPRVDLLVDDASGARRRMTEYTGLVWYGGRPQRSRFGSLTVNVAGSIESPFFLPDSLPYDAAKLADATLSVSVALANVSEHINLFDQSAAFAPDPSG